MHDDILGSESEPWAGYGDVLEDGHADWLEGAGHVGHAHIRRFVQAHATGKDVPHESLRHVVRGLYETLVGITRLQRDGKDDSKARGKLLLDSFKLSQPMGRRKRSHQHLADVHKSRGYLLAKEVFDLQVAGASKPEAVSKVLASEQLKGEDTTRQTINAAYKDYRITVLMDREIENRKNEDEPLNEEIRKWIEEGLKEFLLQSYVAESMLKHKLITRLLQRLQKHPNVMFSIELKDVSYDLRLAVNNCAESLEQFRDKHPDELLNYVLSLESGSSRDCFDLETLVQNHPIKLLHFAISAVEKIK